MRKHFCSLFIAIVYIIIASTPVLAGYLTFIEYQKNGLFGVDGLFGASSVMVSPDGKHVYATGRTDNAISVFSRNASTGRLTFVEYQKDGLNGVDGLYGASSVIVSPDGKHVYATSMFVDKAVSVFSRNASTGRLTFVECEKDGVNGVDGLDGAISVIVSPDGKHLYVAGYYDSAVAVFSRDVTSGQLTFVEYQKDGLNGVDGLDTANSVIVSPDGKHLYVASYYDSAVAVFSRDVTSGQLTFVEYQKDGVNGVDGLYYASSVTVSPDGNQVYATTTGDDTVVVFSRNLTTGRLTFLEYQKDGVNGVDGLDGANSVTVSPDGNQVYATASGDDTVAVFSRDVTSGQLTFVEYEKDGYGVDGLDKASSVAVSPEGNHVYATGYIDQAVAVFQIHQNNLTPPTVTTDSNFTTGLTTAISGGNVTTDGGAYVFERGVCWSTLSNPTISDSKTVDDSGTGSFISYITGLSPLTTYHIRAYATYSAGTSYGNDIMITTNLNIFGMEVNNQWSYDSNIQRKITKIDQTSFSKSTFEMEILENGVLIEKEWYETTNEQLLFWGTLIGGSLFKFDKGLLAVWFPLSVGDQRISSAGVVGYTGTTVSMTVTVLSFETLSLSLGTFDAYRLHYTFTDAGPGGTSTRTFDWWVVPYLGVVKQQTPGGEERLTSFAIGGGTITQDTDADNDSLKDYEELFLYETDWLDVDTDDDGMTDGWEVTYGLDPLDDQDANEDDDQDGFTNLEEYKKGTDPTDPNSHPSRAMPWIPLLLLED